MATPVEIAPYDPDWPDHFSAIERQLHGLLEIRIAAIEHIGSTAIPGMPAKPVIDVDISLHSASDIPVASAILISAGYQSRGSRYGDRVWAFMQHESNPKQRVYLCPPYSETHSRRLVFRDYLRTNPDAEEAYSLLKNQLSLRFPYDGDSYTAGKSDFIDKIVRCAEEIQASPE